MLRPLLFIIYVQDMGEDSSIDTLAYVDDVKAKMVIDNLDDVDKFQM